MSCVLYFLLLQWSLTKAYACAGGLQIPSCQNRISDACSLALRWTIYSFCKCLAPRWSVCLFLECSGRGFQHSTNALNFFAECDASVKCAVLPRATLELCGPPLISYCHCCRWCILSPGARISRAASRVSGIREEKNYRFRKGGTTAIVEQEWTWWQRLGTPWSQARELLQNKGAACCSLLRVEWWLLWWIEGSRREICCTVVWGWLNVGSSTAMSAWAGFVVGFWLVSVLWQLVWSHFNLRSWERVGNCRTEVRCQRF